MSTVLRLISSLVICIAAIIRVSSKRRIVINRKDYIKAYNDIIGKTFLQNSKALNRFLKGIDYYNRENYKNALKIFNSLITDCVSDREFSAVYFFTAISYSEIGLYDNALKAYCNATNYNPHFSSAWSNRGLIHKNLGEFNEAVICLNKAIELDKTNNFAYLNLSSVYLALLDYDKAIDYALTAVTIAPNMYQAYHVLALAYAGKNDKESAEVYYKKSILNGAKDAKAIRDMMDSLYTGDNTVLVQ